MIPKINDAQQSYSYFRENSDEIPSKISHVSINFANKLYHRFELCLSVSRVSLFRDILWKERMENFESTIFRASEFYKCHCRPFWNIYIYIYLTLYLNLQHFCTRHLFFATSILFAFSSHMFTTRCIRVCDRFNLKIVQK